MKKAQILSIVTAFLCFSYSALSQADSTFFDLGRTKLNKNLTQHITVKGADLEKMPFTNIAEALRVWFNGDFNYSATLLYIIDGVLISDANTISIYDIEEVTLIQNALTLTNGNGHHKQLVLIKTRRNREGKNGLSMAAQTFLVNQDFNKIQGNDQSSETGMYHQYQLSAWHNGKNIRAGLSANYVRDIFPGPKSDSVKSKTAFNFDRFRLNGWMNARIGNHHQLLVSMNYVPEMADREEDFTTSYSTNTGRIKVRQAVINPTLLFRSRLSSKWQNEIKASFLTLKSRGTNYTTTNNLVGTLYESETNEKLNTDITNLSLQNHLSYRTAFGNWTLEPAVNFQFRYLKYKSEHFYQQTFNNSPISNSSYTMSGGKGNLFFLTPSIRLQNRNLFTIQAGILANVSKNKGYNSKRVFPFATASVDVLKVYNPQTNWGLQLFGSYAEADDFGEQPVQLNDYTSTYSAGYHIALPTVYFTPYPVIPNSSYSTVNKFFQTGAQFSLPGDKAALSYNFDDREYFDLILVMMPIGTGGGGYSFVNVLTKTNFHRAGLTGKIVASGAMEWTSGINVTKAKVKAQISGTGSTPIYGGGLLNSSSAYTGGWTNRFSYKNFLAGTNLLYIIDESRQTGFASFEKVNSFLLQNVYIGYRWQSARLKNIELCASIKNPWKNENAFRADNRKYYGLGFKAQL